MLAGATGNLGAKIVDALLEHSAEVRALARVKSDNKKIKILRDKGVKVFQVDMLNADEISEACVGVDCVVAALAGLRNVVINTQKALLDGAVKASVPRFIPSDYSLDFTRLVPGTNRNLDLRREFHSYVDEAPINATTIFNGAFMDLLTTDMPLILYRFKRILYWGDAFVKMDLTTMDDVAEFTAQAALDEKAPRYLRVAGDRVSPRDVTDIMNDIECKRFRLFRAGSIKLLNIIIKIAKFFSSAKNNLYPAWQGMQYMRDMMEDRATLIKLDNDRYPHIKWTSVKELLKLL